MTHHRPTRTALSALALLAACTVRPPANAVTPNESAARSAASPTRVTLSIVSTNDLHGHIEALPRLGGFVANLRRARAADRGATLLLDGGDTFQGELASNLNEGAAVVDAFNVLGYSAAAIGNHEFDFGPVGPTASPRPGEDPRGALKARAAQARYPFLSANLVDVKTAQPFAAPNVAPSTLLEAAGVRVGVVGALTLETTRSVLAAVFDGLRLDPLLASITREAQSLRARGATVVVVVAHAGGGCGTSVGDPDDLAACDRDSEIFKVAEGLAPGLVDAIVAGHTHKRLAHRVNGIPIIEAGEHGEALARVDLFVDSETRAVVGHQLYAPIALCTRREPSAVCDAASYEGAPVVDDARVAPIVQAAIAAADALRSQELGVTALAPFKPTNGESALSNLVADLMRRARPTVDITLMHAGGLRADLPAGALRYGDLFQVYPRDSTFAVATLTAAELADAIAKNLGGHGPRLASLSGARASVRCEGERLVVVLRRENGRPIAPGQSLRVATNNLLALGANGPLAGASWSVEDEPPIREELARILRQQGGTLSPTDRALFDPGRPRIELTQVDSCAHDRPVTAGR
jgi:2',3'-cyclic-nucleotide 2'-phosphodiesterase (5'-nucleotidase family)